MDISTRSLFVGLIFITMGSASSIDLNKIKVKLGEDVTLPCDSPKDAVITLLEWIRPDLQSDGYVFFYRDDHLYENYLHKSFLKRVRLKDPEMKDGDVSLILKNVTKKDAGTYTCLLSWSKTRRAKRATADFNKTIELLVENSGHTEEGGDEEGGDKRGHVGLTVVIVVAVVVVISLLMQIKHKQFKEQNSNHHPADGAAG